LASPKEKRAEMHQIKNKLNEYNKFKQNHVLMGHRERMIKGGWRHGITGIENADSENISTFY